MSLTSLDGKKSSSCADTALYSDAWNEFEATAIATANCESSGPEAWRAVAVAVGRLQSEVASMHARRLESSRTLAAQEVAFMKTECAKVRCGYKGTLWHGVIALLSVVQFGGVSCECT